jgi:hypothetical protein
MLYSLQVYQIHGIKLNELDYEEDTNWTLLSLAAGFCHGTNEPLDFVTISCCSTVALGVQGLMSVMDRGDSG